MARVASRWEACRGVVRIRCALVVLLVTAITGRWQGSVVVVDMTVRARRSDMRAGQREGGVVVVEGRRRPGGCGVANVAGLREPGRGVIRVRCAVVVLQMTRSTSSACQVVVSVYMALSALHTGVRAG